MRPEYVIEEEQAVRELSREMSALLAELSRLQSDLSQLRRQHSARTQQLRGLNVKTAPLLPSRTAEYRIKKSLPGKLCSDAMDAHNIPILYQDTVRHVSKGWYGYVADNRILPDGSTRTLVYLQRTQDGRPYRKCIPVVVPTSELEHVYHLPFRPWPA